MLSCSIFFKKLFTNCLFFLWRVLCFDKRVLHLCSKPWPSALHVRRAGICLALSLLECVPMPITFQCRGCKQDQDLNPRLKSPQQYCGEDDCQRERKRVWQQDKRRSDEAYRRRQHAGLVQWRSEDHGLRLSRYQQQYRESHPKYVEKNRAQRRRRNRARRNRDASTKIVKMDALPQTPVPSGFYLLTPCSLDASTKIVKMDAFVVALQVVHGDNASANAASP